MESSVLHVIEYFDLFFYPPTSKEIHQYCQRKLSLTQVETILDKLVMTGGLYKNQNRFAFSKQYFFQFKQKFVNSEKLLSDFSKISPIFTKIPTIQFIGISGSLSMKDADLDADVDLFVITSRGTLWLTRGLILILTRTLSFLGVDIARKLCWNIFIEEDDVVIPKIKRNEYTAHELLQMKPVYDKNVLYSILLFKNAWVSEILPNVQIKSVKDNIDYRLSKQIIILKYISNICKYLQLLWLTKKNFKVTEYGSQVWLIQDDFEKKISIELKKVT